MSAAHYKLGQLVAIVDYNKFQGDAHVADVMGIEPLADKWRSFGWHAVEIDGHDFQSLIDVLDEFDSVNDKPFVIIANTIKGKGVSFMEGNPSWHGKAPNDEQLEEALGELNEFDDSNTGWFRQRNC